MSRLISYPIISTLSSDDLVIISDSLGASYPTNNVTLGALSSFFDTNSSIWTPVAGGINYSGGNVGVGVATFTGYLEVQKVNIENNETRGLNIDIQKENTSGAGFASNVYGIKSYSKANSSETVVNIGGTWSKAEHVGPGRTYYITGGTNRAYHSGGGDSNSIAGTFSEGKVGGTGLGNHEYVVGLNNIAKLDNPNATVGYLQGGHMTVQLNNGEVTDNLMCVIMDIDYSGGSVTGDLEYIRIQNDVLPSVSGVARAINSLSVLPSEFGGSIKSAGLINSAITEHADNTAAIAAGLSVGAHYRTGDLLKIVH